MKMGPYLRFQWDELRKDLVIHMSGAEVNVDRVLETYGGKKVGRLRVGLPTRVPRGTGNATSSSAYLNLNVMNPLLFSSLLAQDKSLSSSKSSRLLFAFRLCRLLARPMILSDSLRCKLKMVYCTFSLPSLGHFPLVEPSQAFVECTYSGIPMLTKID